MTGLRLADALSSLPELRRQIGGRRRAFFLDLDGTLAPIVRHPDQVRLPPDTKAILHRLADRDPVCIVSGRGLDDLAEKIGLDSVYYAAAHGHRIVGPPGSEVELEVGKEYETVLREAGNDLGNRLRSVDGVILEDKGLSLSIHYRLVADGDRPKVDQAVTQVAEHFPELRRTGGKLVHELRPPGDWDKGRAVLWLLDRLGWGKSDACPICIGDDLTDEDMFGAVEGWGLTVVVGELDRSTKAHYRLDDQAAVASFLECFAAGHG